jgi:hypothetical protein
VLQETIESVQQGQIVLHDSNDKGTVQDYLVRRSNALGTVKELESAPRRFGPSVSHATTGGVGCVGCVDLYICIGAGAVVSMALVAFTEQHCGRDAAY